MYAEIVRRFASNLVERLTKDEYRKRRRKHSVPTPSVPSKSGNQFSIVDQSSRCAASEIESIWMSRSSSQALRSRTVRQLTAKGRFRLRIPARDSQHKNI